MIALTWILAQAATPSPAIYDVGLSGCRDGYERARQNPLSLQMLVRWEVGFWSGLNYANRAMVGTVAVKRDMFAIENEIARECDINPNDLIYEAETRVYRRFKETGR